MSFIYLAPGEGVEDTVLDVMESCLSSTFGLPARRSGPLPEPGSAYDPQRRQYSSTHMLRMLAKNVPSDAGRLLGITERDIYIPMLSFIFGQAQLGGSVALISLARLRQEFYHLPSDPGLLLERACKEAMHELGHTFGLTHCLDPRCTMSLSTSLQQVDAKSRMFCRSCTVLLEESVGEMNLKPGHGHDAEEPK